MCKIVIKLLTWRYKSEVADYWAWEMTPLPIGFPYFRQYIEGIKWAFKIRFN